MKKFILSGLALSCLFLTISCDVQTKTEVTVGDVKESEEKKEEAVPVEIAAIGRGEIESIISSSTNLEAESEVKVYARTTNPVVELLVEEGDLVEKDQVLLRLLDDTQTIGVERARAQLEKARKDYARQKELFEKELITQQAYNNIAYDLKSAELQMQEAKRDLDYTEVRAPIGGTVTNRLIKLGDQVNVNQHLFDIVDFESLVARVYLPERNLALLQVDQSARLSVQAMADKVFPGSILRIAPTVDAGTGTVKVTVKVDEIGPLRPGMFVNVEIVLDTHDNALLVPKRSLVYDSDQLFVFRIASEESEGARVERLLLQPVLTDKLNVEPGPEINEGDRIVVAGQTGLKDNALVKIIEDDATDATAAVSDEPEDTDGEVAKQ